MQKLTTFIVAFCALTAGSLAVWHLSHRSISEDYSLYDGIDYELTTPVPASYSNSARKQAKKWFVSDTARGVVRVYGSYSNINGIIKLGNKWVISPKATYEIQGRIHVSEDGSTVWFRTPDRTIVEISANQMFSVDKE